MLLDLVRIPSADCSIEFVKNKVKRDVLVELDALNKSQDNRDFLNGFDTSKYKAHAKKSKILSLVRKRLVRATSTANFLASKQAKKVRSFL